MKRIIFYERIKKAVVLFFIEKIRFMKVVVPIGIFAMIVLGGYCFSKIKGEPFMAWAFIGIFAICIAFTLLWVKIVEMDIQRGG